MHQKKGGPGVKGGKGRRSCCGHSSGWGGREQAVHIPRVQRQGGGGRYGSTTFGLPYHGTPRKRGEEVNGRGKVRTCIRESLSCNANPPIPSSPTTTHHHTPCPPYPSPSTSAMRHPSHPFSPPPPFPPTTPTYTAQEHGGRCRARGHAAALGGLGGRNSRAGAPPHARARCAASRLRHVHRHHLHDASPPGRQAAGGCACAPSNCG